MDAHEGRSAIVQVVGPGAVIGLGRAILNTPANHAVIGIEPVETALIERTAILAAMTADPHVAVAVTELISADHDATELRCRCSSPAGPRTSGSSTYCNTGVGRADN